MGTLAALWSNVVTSRSPCCLYLTLHSHTHTHQEHSGDVRTNSVQVHTRGRRVFCYLKPILAFSGINTLFLTA